MKKVNKLAVILAMALCVVCVEYNNVCAHSLTPWSKIYTKQKAGGNYHFAISDAYHVNGNTVNYYWDNSTTKKYFDSSIKGGISMWDGIIKIKETDEKNAQLKITYNPDMTKNMIAYVNCTTPSLGHYSSNGVRAELVVSDIRNSKQFHKNSVFGHELGHVWGMDDLYDVNTNLASIYSKGDTYPKATQGDRNGMYICLNKPWYYASGPDRRAKYQKAPGVWAKNETLVIDGKSCKFDKNGYLVN